MSVYQARKHLVRAAAITAMIATVSGCGRLAPGIHLNDDDFEYSRPLREGEEVAIPVLTLSPEVILAEDARVAAGQQAAATEPPIPAIAELSSGRS